MKQEKRLGEELIEAIDEVLTDKSKLRMVRPHIDIMGLRKKLRMSQKEFSENFRINLESVRNWEQRKRFPDSATIAYLTCIEKSPKDIIRLLSSDPHETAKFIA